MNRTEYINFYKSLPEKLEYENTHQYREIIRYVFRFNPNEVSYYGDTKETIDINTIDSESKDELLFDSEAIQIHMDILYFLTINESIFQTLYAKAAGLFFSTDLSIGQVAICSYDTFSWYHTCIWHFLHFGKLECEEYRKLIRHL